MTLRRSALPVLLTVLSVLASSGALASQPDPERREASVPLGSRIPRWDMSMAVEREAVQVLRRFAVCVVRTNPAGVTAMLATVPGSLEERTAAQGLADRQNNCLWARRMRLRTSLFRGALAEALLDRNDLSERLQARPSPEGFDAFSARLAAVDQGELNEDDVAQIVGRWVSYCVANEHPELIETLLATRFSSSAEQQALTASQDAFSACLLERQALRVDRLTMRGLLADALYQRAHDASRTAAADAEPAPGR